MDPLFVISKAGKAFPKWVNSFRAEAPGVDVFSRLGSERQYSEKHGWRIWASSCRWACSGSGYPSKSSPEYDSIRQATPEMAQQLRELQAKIKELQAAHLTLLQQAWKEGSAVHVSQAENYENALTRFQDRTIAAQASEPAP